MVAGRPARVARIEGEKKTRGVVMPGHQTRNMVKGRPKDKQEE